MVSHQGRERVILNKQQRGVACPLTVCALEIGKAGNSFNFLSLLKKKISLVGVEGGCLSCWLDFNLNWLLFKEVSCKKKVPLYVQQLVKQLFAYLPRKMSAISQQNKEQITIFHVGSSESPSLTEALSLKSEQHYTADLVLTLLKSMAKLQNRVSIEST